MILGGWTFWYVVIVGLAIIVATVRSSVVTVTPETVGAYTVLGEYRELLDPGLHVVWPFVTQVDHYERSPELTVTETANTADGGRVEATVQLNLERGDIERAYETKAVLGMDPIPELQDEARGLLRTQIRDRDTDAVLTAHVDIERALYRDLERFTRERFHYLEDIDTLAIERVERAQ